MCDKISLVSNLLTMWVHDEGCSLLLFCFTQKFDSAKVIDESVRATM